MQVYIANLSYSTRCEEAIVALVVPASSSEEALAKAKDWGERTLPQWPKNRYVWVEDGPLELDVEPIEVYSDYWQR